MKKYFVICSILMLMANCQTSAQKKSSKNKKYKVEKTKEEWRKKLTPMQFHILREAGTERPGSSKYNQHFKKGIYVCAACNTPLYKSEKKYDAGCGWPSFDEAIEKNIETDIDYKIGYARVELKCKTCGGHLGHRFEDGPKTTTGKRHCINGAALKFVPDKAK